MGKLFQEKCEAESIWVLVAIEVGPAASLTAQDQEDFDLWPRKQEGGSSRMRQCEPRGTVARLW